MEGAITGNVYLDMLQKVQIPLIDEDDSQECAGSQRNGSPPNFHTNVREFLNGHFPDLWVGRDGSIAWPPRSPDLTPLDFFLWRCVKGKVCHPPLPKTVDDL
jgi:hypothetical protein